MAENRLRKLNDESGVAIIEATIVFPVMFIVLFFLIFMGNVFYEKAQVEAVVVENAISGANHCTDPLLETIKSGNIPSVSELKTEPYRYIFGGREEVEKKIATQVERTIKGESFSFFKNMKPRILTSQGEIAKFNNYVVYATFSVEVKYVIEFPIKFLGADAPPMLTISSRAEVAVNDTTEFIRNTDMVIDLFHGTKIGQKVSDAFGKINDFISQFASK